MKKLFLNTLFVYIMFATGCSTAILSIIFVIFDIKNINTYIFFQVVGVNFVIVTGIFLLHKFECRNIIMEYVRDISYAIIVLVIFGIIFNWFIVIPVWVFIVTAVINYTIAIITSIIKIHKDANEMNELIKKRKEKRKKIVFK